MSKRKTSGEFNAQVFDIVGDEYTVLSEYQNNKKKITISHNVCQEIYSVRPDNFLSGKRCPKCSKKKVADKQRRTQEEFVQEVANILGQEYTVLGEYLASLKPVKMRHNTCGNEYVALPNNILRGATCLECANKSRNIGNRKTHNEFIAEVNEHLLGEYKVLSTYESAFKHVEVEHVVCGNKYSVTPDNLLRGRRCRCITESKGVVLIGKILQNMGMPFEKEYTFEDCRHIKKLRFDFMVMDKDKPVIAIEYDGRQHFEPIDYYGGERFFSLTVMRDEIKNEYCKNNNIKIVRIPYTYSEKQIEELIVRLLK